MRIDEIYSNTFWQWAQRNKPLTRVFFCDPPGTSVPSNLFNHGAEYGENYITEKDYIFFHDQEPIHLDIHKSLFEDVIERNKDIIERNKDIIPIVNGHVVTSERDSDFLDELIDTYGWEAHYYFFHGWAALDWYRGYNHTFLIPRAKDRNPTKAFTSPNRIVGGRRDHRVLFLYHAFKNRLNNNHISAPLVCPEENIPIVDIAKKYEHVYSDITDVLEAQSLPQLFKHENTQVMSSCWLSNFNESADSIFYVPTETVYFGRRLHLTEKTFKPIALEMPFILVATAGSLEYLRSYGFKTFDGIIDESYDEETDDILRLEKVTKLLCDIDRLSEVEKQNIHRQCIPIVEHNYNHFYYGNFEKILWNELTNMLEELL